MNRSRAFTLVELLVVIAIIGILGGLAVVGIMSAMENAKQNETKMLITNLKGAIESFEQATSSYPPPGLGTDTVNTGIESALLCVRSTLRGGPFMDLSEITDYLTNLDGDSSAQLYTQFGVEGNGELFEVSDPWGSPLVYVPEAGNGYAVGYTYYDAENAQYQAQIQPIEKTGTYPENFAIWSLGSDGINQNGREDDITSWGNDD